MQPYTYLIGWTHLSKYYYGCRWTKKGSQTPEEDLWKKYFTSSYEVKNFRKKHGEPNIVQIRRKFDDTYSCREWEAKVLRRINRVHSFICKDSPFLNRSVSNGKYWSPLSRLSDNTKAKISVAMTGRIFTEAHRRNLSVARKKAGLEGRWKKKNPHILTQQGRLKISIRMKYENPMHKLQGQVQWITDGLIETKVQKEAQLPDGWKVGRLKRVFISDGVITTRILAHEPTPEGFIRNKRIIHRKK